MSRRRKRQSRKKPKKAMTIKSVIIIVAAIVVIAVVAAIIYNIQKTVTDNGETVKERNLETGITFPYTLEDGRLSVESVFQFTGSNPDNANADGENIAALNVTNQSEQHLVSAEIKVKSADNTELTFELTDIPAGQTVMVFEKDNQTYDLNDVCEEITDTAKFEEEPVLMADRISIDVQETTVTLTNNSEEDLSNLLLHCHCLIDNSYFGGLTYTYPVESIPAGQSTSVEAGDCYLGEATVVRVSQDEGGE